MVVRHSAGRAWSAYSTVVDKLFGLLDPIVFAMFRATAWGLSRLSEDSFRYEAPDSLRGWFTRDGSLTLWRVPDDDPIDDVYRRVGRTEIGVVVLPVLFDLLLMVTIGEAVRYIFGAAAAVAILFLLLMVVLQTLHHSDAIAVEVEHG